MTDLSALIDTDRHRLTDAAWLGEKRNELNGQGVVQMRGLLQPAALADLQNESAMGLNQAYFKPQSHNIYLDKGDEALPNSHIRNRRVTSSKGCITDDQIATRSVLKQIYHHANFTSALCLILGENALYPYADSLSSVNIHYARRGEELNWHFDNSSFAITLMINEVSRGGEFEYTEPLRGPLINQAKEFENVSNVLNGKTEIKKISMKSGGLLLFNGKNSMHRVTKVHCDEIRILAVLAYNDKPCVSLSKSAQMTFYGRTDG